MAIVTHVPRCNHPWPELNYESWSDTLKTVHLWTQIVGKIRLQAMPWINHSWHTTLYIHPSGLSTGSIPYADGLFEIVLDFTDHRLKILSSFQEERSMKLGSKSVAVFYKEIFQLLDELGIKVNIHAAPNEIEDNTPFAENHSLSSYDEQMVSNFWQVAIKIHNVFSEFRGQFIGKSSPVHFFWGAFDIALTRFSGRKAPEHPGEAPNMPKDVMKEAYSQEVSSAGFWPGSDDSPHPVFYSYCYPTPKSFGKQPVKPQEAFYSDDMGEFFLPYDAVRSAENPEEKLMEFLQSTYAAAAEVLNWNRSELER